MLLRVRRLWAELAGAPVTFGDSGVEVVVSPASLLCPPGWVGIVALGGSAIATAPDAHSAEGLRQALHGLSAAQTIAGGSLPAAETLGPAILAYCDPAGFRPAPFRTVEVIPADHPDVTALLARVSAEDAGEAGLDDITSPAFVVRAGGHVVAAAGYREWPGETAHLSVLTELVHRGRGLAGAVSSAAVTEALAAGLMPQWRARPAASRRVARALGFRELGGQLSIRLAS